MRLVNGCSRDANSLLQTTRFFVCLDSANSPAVVLQWDGILVFLLREYVFWKKVLLCKGSLLSELKMISVVSGCHLHLR